MITIIEGPDCSGKTTLMKQLFQASDGFIHEHCGPPPKEGPWLQYSQALQFWWNKPLLQVVYDRFLYGELIYGRTRNSAFSPVYARMLERVLWSMQAVLICAQTDLDVSLRLWQERQEGERFKSPILIEAFHALFTDLFAVGQGTVPSLPKVHYDFQRTNLEHLRQELARARPVENLGPGIGNFAYGTTLMVGEQVNQTIALDPRWPFVAATGSSLWLAERLEEAKVSERQLYWVNAITDGIETDPAFLTYLKPSRIIALGTTASVWCDKHKLQHVGLRHPQFWKRFRGKDPYPLLEALAQPQVDLFKETR